MQTAREAASVGCAGAESATWGSETEALRRQAEDLRQDNGQLESRLRKYRAAASADLERAVPLNTPSCWHSIDSPAMRVATFLVRSLFLRRIFAVHLIATYGWLCFLIFWLEKH